MGRISKPKGLLRVLMRAVAAVLASWLGKQKLP